MNFVSELRNLDIEENDLSLHLNEAKFGFDHIYKYCDELKIRSNVLEIGCGSGILLGMLYSKYKDIEFEGIEPFESGLENFSKLSLLNDHITKMKIKIYNKNYEEFMPKKKYELIFCINVFEHLNNWRDFIDQTSNWLKPGGRIVVLCPNYALPYESHFKLPIIYNKKLTYRIFENYISNFEKKNNFCGLWNSLNFVKKNNVKKYLNNSNKLKLFDDLSIIDHLVNRLLHDENFKKRQKFIGLVATVFKKFGIIKLLKLFPNYIPYMKLEFKRM